GVRLREQDGTESELEADLTVAADGRWSIARDGGMLPTVEYPVPFDVWWLRLPRRDDDGADALMPSMRARALAVVIPRKDYYQIAYIGPKGSDAELRTSGIEAFRRRVAE